MVGADVSEELILRSIRKKALTTVLVVSYFALSAIGALVGALLDENEAWRLLAIPLAVPFMVGAAWFSHRGLGFFGGRQSEVARLLLEPRGEVVWIYPYQMVIHVYVVLPLTLSKSVVIGCLDGRRFHLPLPLGTGDQLEEAVRSCAPHACVGHSREREAKFRNDPASLQTEGLPIGARPPARRLDAVASRGGLFAAWREMTEHIEGELSWLPGRALRERTERVPIVIRMLLFLMALTRGAYEMATNSGVYAWLVEMERKLQLGRYGLPAIVLCTMLVYLIAAVIPVLVLAAFLPPKKMQ